MNLASSFVTISLPDSGTVNWILFTAFVIRIGLDILTWLSPTALRYLASWAIARAAGIDAMNENVRATTLHEQQRLGLKPLVKKQEIAPNQVGTKTAFWQKLWQPNK